MKQILITIAAVVLVGCGPRMSIHEAAKDGKIEAVKQAIAAGADVNAKGFLDKSPLHKAAYRGHKEVVELLIAEGADVNALTDEDFGNTPLDVAEVKLKELLRKHGGKTAEELKAAGN